MSFQSPELLWLLLLPPLLAGWGWLELRRGRGSGFAWLPEAARFRGAARGSRWLSWGLYGLALVLGLVALARPQAWITVLAERSNVVMVMDVSFSMQADDVEPNRLEAAKVAARLFIDDVPSSVYIGLVSFAQTAQVESPLSRNHKGVQEQVRLLALRDTTAIGDGLMLGLELFDLGGRKALIPSSIILLSDGRNKMGVDPKEAAQRAAELGVVVHTIGVGSSDAFASRLVPGEGFDEGELRAISEITGGQFFTAESAEALKKIYQELGRTVSTRREPTEIAAFFSLAAGLLLMASLVLAQLSRRVL
ncbi:MAG: VWA domain-containing protein [Meiothermus sp.]|nr:VWA domain-containing protein [Meiothermus sp.]